MKKQLDYLAQTGPKRVFTLEKVTQVFFKGKNEILFTNEAGEEVKIDLQPEGLDELKQALKGMEGL